MRNSLSPVNKLPPEIISQIARSSLEPHHIDPKPIIPLTHVCQYWRESIISTPENWTLISSTQLDLAALSLERSRAALLRLHLDVSSPPYDFCDLLAPHAQRIRTVQVEEIEIIEDITEGLPNFPLSMPNLQSLDLAHTEDYDDVSDWDSPLNPFGSFPTTLTSLCLYDIPMYPSFLELRALRELRLRYYKIHPALDTLLNFVEDNCSLESVDLTINFHNSPSSSYRHRSATTNRLQHLSVSCLDATTARTLISNIPLRKGAHLDITFRDKEVDLNDILSGIPTTHFPNLPSPTFMEYKASPRAIRLIGPNGSFSYYHDFPPGIPFTEFSVLPLINIRELRLVYDGPPITFDPSSFPVLETLTLDCITGMSRLFSTWLSDHSLFPSLKTLGFLECVITEDFMEELTRFASNRKNTVSAWLHRVVIVHRDGVFPSAASIHRLERHVSIVDVRFGTDLPVDLT